MARFDHRATQPARGPKDIIRWRLARARGDVPHDPDPSFVPRSRPNDGSAIRELASSLTWVGHATFALQLGGKLALVDPVWSKRVSGVIPRHVAPGVALDALPPVDMVMVTHNHRDHLDLPTIELLGPGPQYVVPLGNGPLLRRAGARRVVELDWWQSHREGGLEVTLVPARHWSMRAPWDRNQMLWGGFVARGAEGVAYHSGDTALFDGFAEITRRLGPIDWAMLPIGAYEPRWFMQPQHMDPEEAGAAFLALGARTFVAMHWGTFKLTDEPLSEPPRRLEEWWSRTGLARSRLWIPEIGETRGLDSGSKAQAGTG